MSVVTGDASPEPDALAPPALLDDVLALVRAHPAGLSEHAAIDALRRQGVTPFAGSNLREPLALFRCHFVLFHCLYRLRDRRLAAGEWLRIDCLDIGLEPLDPSVHPVPNGDEPAAMTAHDPLRAYYLDGSRLAAMDAAGVEALLSRFWQRLDRHERRRRALAILDLDADASDAAVAARFRALVQRHHPDRGGDTATLQRLNEARWILLGG